MSFACVEEPEGIRTPLGSDERDEVATAGESFGDEAEEISCAELSIVREKCGRCHASPPEHGAPFSLLSLDDINRINASGVPTRARMADAIERGTMPARYLALDPPVTELSDDERASLLTWLRAADSEEAARCD